jgi:hypothetical protein
MISADRTKARLFVGALVLCLSACGGSDPAASTAANQVKTAHKPRVAVKKGPTVAEQTVGMVAAVTLGKSNVPVTLKYEFDAKPRVGAPLDINLAVLPQVPADGGKVAVTAAEGFEPLPPDAATALDPMVPDEVYKRSVRVTPAKAGVLLLALGVDLTHDEITETREFTVPVLVEDPPPAPK